jgi:hypothetical protein
MPEIFDVPPPPASVMEVAHELEAELVRSFESSLGIDGDERSRASS